MIIAESVDFDGIAAVMVALGTCIASITAAVYGFKTRREVKSPNGTLTGVGVAEVNRNLNKHLAANVNQAHPKK